MCDVTTFYSSTKQLPAVIVIDKINTSHFYFDVLHTPLRKISCILLHLVAVFIMLLSPRRATSALVVLNNRLLPLKLLTYCSRLHATYWYKESKHQQWQQLWALEVQQQWKKKQEQCRCLQSLATQRNNKTAPFARPPLSLLLAATQDRLLNDAALVCWGLLWCVRPIKTLYCEPQARLF